jgi:hypothetical protein
MLQQLCNSGLLSPRHRSLDVLPMQQLIPETKSDFLMFERWWLSLARGFESEGQDQ